MTAPASGVLAVDKPMGISSHDVVVTVRRLWRGKVGHGGTLDPLATGVLPVLLGQATKLSAFTTDLAKGYVTTMRLGQRSDTLDATGTIVDGAAVPVDLTPAAIDAAAQRFVGEIEQLPPMYSAVRVQGKRLYELARRGEEVERRPRPVVIHEIAVTRVELPEVELRVRCGKGTYIRQLVADIGDRLGCGAHVTRLRRTAVGALDETIAVPLGELGDRDAIAGALIPPLRYLGATMPCLALDAALAVRVRQGQRPSWGDLGEAALPLGTRFVLAAGDELVAVAEAEAAGYRLLRVWAGA